MKETVLEVKDLSFSYKEQSVLSNISFDVYKGDYFGILGPNGSGKTTLLKLCIGLINSSKGSVKLFGEDIKDFDCSNCDNLQSLNGCPKEVGGYFDCSHCKNLKSLNGAPETVNGYFDCSGCKNLQSLEGCPETVIDFYCYGCINLQSLEGCPEKVNGNFSCSNCDNLKSLNGAPETVNGYFDCSDCNNLQSLNGAPKEVGGDFYCSGCNLDFIELAKQKYGDKVKYK